jgi:hypothetical protein
LIKETWPYELGACGVRIIIRTMLRFVIDGDKTALEIIEVENAAFCVLLVVDNGNGGSLWFDLIM